MGHDAATGYVYITTKNKVNEIFCQRDFAFDDSQKAEIDAFRAFLNGLQLTGGLINGDDTTRGDDVDTIDVGDRVGSADDTETPNTNLVYGDEDSGEVVNTGFLASVQNFLGFGDEGTTTVEEPTSDRGLAAVAYSGFVSIITSYWFIFLLIVFATILFLRIRGAEKE